MSHILYGQSIDLATLTYSATEDTNYPIQRIQDRDINSFFRDLNIAAVNVTILIDFGTARSADHLILGNYLATSVDDVVWIALQSADDAAITVNATTHINTQEIQSATLTDYIKTFTNGGTARRYWKITIADDAAANLDDLQIGSIFLGDKITLDHNPSVGKTKSHGITAVVREALGGNRAGRKLRSSNRKMWTWDLTYFDDDNSNLTDLETFVTDVGMSEGLSALPFYFSEDSGSTILFGRSNGRHSLSEIGDSVWNFQLALEEEL